MGKQLLEMHLERLVFYAIHHNLSLLGQRNYLKFYVYTKSLISAMRAHIEDGRIIINNLFMVSKQDVINGNLVYFRCLFTQCQLIFIWWNFQKLRGKQSIAIDVAKHQPDFLLQEWLGGGLKRGEGNASDQGKGHKYLQLDDSENIDLELTKWMDSRKDGSSETRRGQERRIKIAEEEKPNKDFAEKSFSNVDVASLKLTYPHCRFKPSKQEPAKPEEKRVTIHLKSQGKDLPKLIILPDSKVELLGLAGKIIYFLMRSLKKLTRICKSKELIRTQRLLHKEFLILNV